MTFALLISQTAGSIVVSTCRHAYQLCVDSRGILFTCWTKSFSLTSHSMIVASSDCIHCCGSHSSIAICEGSFDHVILFVSGHVADVVAQWAVSAYVSRLATPVA
jgi:hypothetical protein